MPRPLHDEANESRTQAVSVKRRLATSQGVQGDSSTLPRSKKHKPSRPKAKPPLKEKKILAKPFGEKHDFYSKEYKSQLLKKGRRTKWQVDRRPALPHFSDPVEAQEAYDPAMSAHRAGPLAWNQGDTGTIRTSLRGKVVPASKLGNNRLATGFTSSRQ